MPAPDGDDGDAAAAGEWLFRSNYHHLHFRFSFVSSIVIIGKAGTVTTSAWLASLACGCSLGGDAAT